MVHTAAVRARNVIPEFTRSANGLHVRTWLGKLERLRVLSGWDDARFTLSAICSLAGKAAVW